MDVHKYKVKRNALPVSAFIWAWQEMCGEDINFTNRNGGMKLKNFITLWKYKGNEEKKEQLGRPRQS